MIATPPTPLDLFRDAVMTDPAAQAHLAEPLDPAVFEARAIAWAAARGITLAPADLRPARAPLPRAEWPGPGWLPVRFSAAPEPMLEWRHFSDVSPNAPFFDDAALEARYRPFNRLMSVVTPLAALPADTRFRAPAGLVFHMSRCGSTLVSQMLGAAPGHVSIAEASPFDTALRHDFADPDVHIQALRMLAHAYARGAAHLFLKLDSWHSLALPLLRRAFPDTPWLFLYRDPVEVMVSHQRQRGVHTVPGLVPLSWFGFETGQTDLPEREFTAQVLARICRAVVEHGRGEGLLVNYAELPEALFTRILPHFGMRPDAEAHAAMTAAAGRNAKAPGSSFSPDRAEKQRAADTDLRALADRLVAPIFAELEALRAAS